MPFIYPNVNLEAPHMRRVRRFPAISLAPADRVRVLVEVLDMEYYGRRFVDSVGVDSSVIQGRSSPLTGPLKRRSSQIAGLSILIPGSFVSA